MKQYTADSGMHIDAIGYGTFRIPPGEDTYRAVSEALEIGYRSIDTARYYENEADVGRAVENFGKQIQITTKVWNDMRGYQKALDSARKSRDLLKRDTIDLLLIHWPGTDSKQMLDTWSAFEELQAEGTVSHIGVSNFCIHHLEAIAKAGLSRPSSNQVELNPVFTQRGLREYCNSKGIIIEAWRPLMDGQLHFLQDIENIAQKHHKTLAQIALAWAVTNGMRVLPKSVNNTRMKENLAIFDFQLSEQEQERIESLNRNLREGPDPDSF